MPKEIEKLETYINNAFKKEQDNYPRRTEIESITDGTTTVFYIAFENEIRMEYYDYGDSVLCLLIPNGLINIDYYFAEKEDKKATEWLFYRAGAETSLLETDTAFYRALYSIYPPSAGVNPIFNKSR